MNRSGAPRRCNSCWSDARANQSSHELNDLLLSCHNSREAYDVIQQQAQQILPVKVGALYIKHG